MVKEPRPGRVKTRLGRSIGMTRAAWWYRHQVRRLLRQIKDPRWEVVLAVAPDVEGLQSRVWPSHVARMPQGGGDLGMRMARCLAMTPGPSVLIGSDIPAVSRAHLSKAFAELDRAASVLGPAPDGGYWLVGLRHPSRRKPEIFRNVRWSHPETLADTLRTLPAPIAFVDSLSDVDEAADLIRR